jgi:succinoglycan biosynthesis protein ExoM
MHNQYITEPAKISIAICTRERPKMLSALLQSLEHLRYPQGVEVTIDIIENHTQKNQTDIIQHASTSAPVEVQHHWEPRLGIPIARNTALKIARESNATHIIFIDDDEHVAPQWLEQLWSMYLQFSSSSVIQGAILSSINTEKNKHLHRYFQRPIKTTGQNLRVCATNNVLIELDTLDQNQLQFDESRPLAGGTDSKLFRKAHKLGIPMIYCAEAIVYENVPEERVNLAWLGKRHFRVGLTYGQHQRVTGAGFSFLTIQSKAALRHLFSFIYCCIRLKRRKIPQKWLKTCKTTGRVLGFFHVTVNSYKKTDGD